MAKTFAQLNEELEALKAKAEAARQAEKPGVIAKILEAIRVYELTPRDLFGTAAKPIRLESKKPSKSTVAKKSNSSASSGPTAKYGDASGNTWSGRGPKPNWLKLAIAEGKSMESFRTDLPTEEPAAHDAEPASSAAAPKSKGKKKAPRPANKDGQFVSVLKYKNDVGQTWSGRGPQPSWVKDALTSGKTLEELAI